MAQSTALDNGQCWSSRDVLQPLHKQLGMWRPNMPVPEDSFTRIVIRRGASPLELCFTDVTTSVRMEACCQGMDCQFCHLEPVAWRYLETHAVPMSRP